MRANVQVITTPTSDTPGTTLSLNFDDGRYLIGRFAESTQRACTQMGTNLPKVRHCFISGRTEWSNIGGMIGMILTLADSIAASHASVEEELLKKVRRRGKAQLWSKDQMEAAEQEALQDLKTPKLTFFGAPNLNYALATARRFVFRKGMPVEIHEVGENDNYATTNDDWAPTWADERIKVWSMPILPIRNSNGAVSASENERPGSRKRSFDEVEDTAISAADVPVEQELTQRQRDLLTAKAVVSEMFDSSWRLDSLFETPLSKVMLPAAIFVRNPETHKIEQYQGPLPGQEPGPEDPHIPVLVRRPWPGAEIEALPQTEPAPEAISYIIRAHDQRGKFLVDQAEKLGVAQKRDYSLLQNGQSVQSKDGTTITPEMVLGEPTQGNGFAVIDLPDPTYIDNLVNRREWLEPKVMAGVGTMFWICEKGVASDPRVHTFMQQFNHLEHVVSSPEYCPNNIAMDSVAISAARFKMIDPARHNVPFHDLNDPSHGLLPLPASVRIAKRGLSLQLQPASEIQVDGVVEPIDLSNTTVTKSVLEEAVKAQKAVEDDAPQAAAWAATIPDKDAEIITLGTGSALPSKYRNVSSTLVRVPGWGCLLFDAGEGTLGQLRRVFSPEEVREVLKSLRAIFISHMHADHHLGLTSVIKAWYEDVHGSRPARPMSPSVSSSVLLMNRDRLSIVAEPAMLQWLAEYSSVEDYGYSRITPVLCSAAKPDISHSSMLRWHRSAADIAATAANNTRANSDRHNIIEPNDLGFRDIQSVYVNHCHHASAYSVTLPSGFKVSYSGDCRPSWKLKLIGRGSTVCIHEATFDDELRGDAMAKKHCTTSEALGVAQAMGAKACVLTHFSQRYQKMPVMDRQDSDRADHAVAKESDLAGNRPPMEESDEVEQSHADARPLQQETAVTANDHEGVREVQSSRIESPDQATFKFKLTSDMKVCVAFDYMRVKVGEIGQVEKFVPAMSMLFAEDESRKAEVKEINKSKTLKEQGPGRKSKKTQGKSADQEKTTARSRSHSRRRKSQDEQLDN